MASSCTSSSRSAAARLNDPTCVRAPRTSDNGVPSSTVPERFASRVRTREALRAVCMYVDALEAGMRLPFHPFFVAMLDHLGISLNQRWLCCALPLHRRAAVAARVPTLLPGQRRRRLALRPALLQDQGVEGILLPVIISIVAMLRAVGGAFQVHLLRAGAHQRREGHYS